MKAMSPLSLLRSMNMAWSESVEEVLRLHIRYLNTSTSLLSFSFWKKEDSQKLFAVLIFDSC